MAVEVLDEGIIKVPNPTGDVRKRLSASERHDRKRYYAQTAFKYERRRWTDDEDKLVLIQRIPDSELSPIIKRSMKSISNRRWRLRKAASENKQTGLAGE